MTPETPSKAARRAAELCLEQSYGVASNGQDFQTLLWGDQVPLFAEIIERETGAGEAAQIIEELIEFADAMQGICDSHRDYAGRDEIGRSIVEACEFLQRFNQD